MHRPGFTLADLTAAVVMFAALLFFSLAATSGLDSTSNRVRCASNLRQIGQAMLLYCNDTKGTYPRTKYDAAQADHPTAFAGVDSTDPFSSTCPQVNDVSAALFILLRTEDIVSTVFICPSSGLRADVFGGGIHTALDHANFSSAENLSYSYADPYPNAAAASAGYDLSMTSNHVIDPTFAIAADINPGAPELMQLSLASSSDDMRKGNSPNHSGNGQNILYADGHVEFLNNPFGGVNRDNIYTFGPSGSGQSSSGAGIVSSPIGPGDSVLLPMVNMPAAPAAAVVPVAAAPAPLTDQGTDFTLYAGISVGVFLLILLAALAAVVLRKRKRADGG